MALTPPPEANYNEEKVPSYALPELLGGPENPVAHAAEWNTRRRLEILNLFSEYVYGRTPEKAWEMAVDKRVISKTALSNGTLEEWDLRLKTDFGEHTVRMLLAVPLSKGPHPVFIGLNFRGNQTTHQDPSITITNRWVNPSAEAGIDGHVAGEASRGTKQESWPFESILARGYAVATVHSAEFAPDDKDHFREGVIRLFTKDVDSERAPDEWGAIGAWAWGLSRMADAVVEDARFDARRLAVTGHSRKGKAALWAGAQDTRFGLVISNNSGCGGAAPSRRKFGETVWQINWSFPHWFCPCFHTYADREEALPVDQHMLLALIAPRALHVCSAADDLWADPRGEFLSVSHTVPVYRLLGAGEIADFTSFPSEDGFLSGRAAYHIRPGKHGITPLDWQRHMDTADRFCAGERVSREP